MKNKYILATITLFIGIAIGWFMPSVHNRFTQGQLTQALSDLRQLQLAIKTYSLDAKSSGAIQIYPKSFNELVENNYVTSDDLSKLVSSTRIEYTEPTDSSSSDPVILVSYPKGKKAICTLSGHIQIGSIN